MRVPTLLGVTAVAALAVAAPASAETVHDVDVIAHGLDNPRHVAVSRHGEVFVAEAGRGGDHATSRSCFDSAEGFACTGATGAVTRIAWHRRHYDQERVLDGLASFGPVDGSSAIGPHGVFVSGRDLYVTNGGPTAPTRGTPPEVVLRDPTLVAEEPVSRFYGTLLSAEATRRCAAARRPLALRARQQPGRRCGQPACRQQPGRRVRGPQAARSWPTRAATACCACPSAAGSVC